MFEYRILKATELINLRTSTNYIVPDLLFPPGPPAAADH
jgi:hypothetical protein